MPHKALANANQKNVSAIAKSKNEVPVKNVKGTIIAFLPQRSTAIPAGYTAKSPNRLPTAKAIPISSYASCIRKLPIIGMILNKPPVLVRAWESAIPLTSTNPILLDNIFN